MLSERIKQLRTARGLTLEALATEMGGIVSPQALSKYEHGKDRPSPRVLSQLAQALGVKAASLMGPPAIQVEIIAYRKLSSLPKRDQTRIENLVTEELERRVHLQELTQAAAEEPDLPLRAFRVATIEDADAAAEGVRVRWNLGVDPLASVTGVLEDHYCHVLEVDAPEDFHGISALARNDDREVVAAAVVTRRGVPGDRQRFNLAHELGHLVMEVPDELLAEKAAHRFAAAFLAPAKAVFREVGTRRSNIQSDELRLLKSSFGMSIQALLYRLHDLGIITSTYYKEWCIHVSRLGWRKREPGELPPEQPQWLRRNALRAFTEGLLPREEAERMVGEDLPYTPSRSLLEKRAFMKLSLEERRRILAEQAEDARPHYEPGSDWQEIQAGDLVDY